MRYLVISPCEDVRTGAVFAVGDEFLPEPDPEQGERLVKAGCLRVIPDNAPALPGSDDTAQVIADLRAKVAATAIDAGSQISAINARLADAIAQHDSLVADLDTARTQLDAANVDLGKARKEAGQMTARIAELEGLLAEATKPVEDVTEQAEPAAKPVKAKG